MFNGKRLPVSKPQSSGCAPCMLTVIRGDGNSDDDGGNGSHATLLQNHCHYHYQICCSTKMISNAVAWETSPFSPAWRNPQETSQKDAERKTSGWLAPSQHKAKGLWEALISADFWPLCLHGWCSTWPFGEPSRLQGRSEGRSQRNDPNQDHKLEMMDFRQGPDESCGVIENKRNLPAHLFQSGHLRLCYDN